MKKIAIILSGNGVFDGAEIHESVLTMLAVEENSASYHCFAPNIQQQQVINHLTGEVVNGQQRNVLEESARIARGQISPLEELNVADFDGVVLPGGFGAAKNLCNFAFKGAQMEVNAVVFEKCQAFALAGKPAGYACIAPVIIPKVYPRGVKMTIGNDPETAKAVEVMGASHVNCAVDEVVIDSKHNVLSSPAYMLASNILEAKASIEKLVETLIKRI